MFLNSAIYDHLDKTISLKMNKEGLSLVRSGSIRKISFDQEHQLFEIEVADGRLYKVEIKYLNAFRLGHAQCTCGIPHCQHEAAALHFLVSKSDQEINAVRDFTRELIKQAKEHQQDTVEEIEAVLLPNGTPNTFRKLPEKMFESWAAFMNYASQEFSNFTSFQRQIRAKLNPDGVIEATVREPNVNAMSEEKEAHVFIRKKDGNWEIKCSECLSSTRKLCTHQSYLLKRYFGENGLKAILSRSYETVLKELAQEAGLTQEKFKHIYQVAIERGQFVPYKKDLNYLTSTDLAEMNTFLFNLYGSRINLEKARLEAKGTKEDENYQNAYVWQPETYTSKPTLIEGKAAKYGRKLVSSIETAERPDFFNQDQKQLAGRISEIFDKYPVERPIQVRAMLHLISERRHTFENMMHFYLPHGYELKKSYLLPINWRQDTAKVAFVVEQDEVFININMVCKIGDKVVKEKLVNFGLFVLEGDSAFLFEDEFQHLLWQNPMFNKVVIDKEEKIKAVQIITSLLDHHEVELANDFEINSEICHNAVKELFISESGNSLIFQLFLRISDNLKINILQDSYVFAEDVLYEVAEEDKENFIQLIAGSHETLNRNYRESGTFTIPIAECLKNAWFLKFFEFCRNQEIAVFGQENLKNFRFNTNNASINTNISSGIDWFDVNVVIKFGDVTVKHKDWIESVRNNEKYIQLDDGTYGIIPEEWYEKLSRLAKVIDVDGERLIINKFKFGIIDQLYEELSDDMLYQDMKYRLSKLSDASSITEYSLPDSIQATLRKYQMEGYNWLRTLDDISFGGCLADDMGLGKTLQIITLLAHQKDLRKTTSLIVVPRSLMFNWAAEIDKFCPSLSYMLYHGPLRKESQSRVFDFDLIITTYDTASIDIEFFREHFFNYIVLDESQAIKNPNSKRYKAMRLLKSRNKLVMTGTPLENNTFDLYAQFSFINPGMFGTQGSFREKFSTPIDKEGDEVAADMLRRIIKPFFLRRTKELVASDLPPKTENIIYCEMDTTQREMYEALKGQIKNEIEGNIKINGLEKSRFKILEGLLRLRQMCNAPQLLDNTLPKHRQTSVKIETLLDIITNDLGDHNALIFSQFTSMLDLIRKELDKREIKYAYLDGSTRDRKGAVDNFQDREDIQLFLISLKAGNTGLNLVKADYVYIVDPWWNPAVESQAIDRTHRIGQDKHIFAYKMICKDTIEEKIMLLQQKKKKIAEDIIVTEDAALNSLNKEELLDLFV